MKVMVITDVIYVLGTATKETGRLGNKRASGDDTNFSIGEIDQNIKKNPIDFWKFAGHSDSSGKPSANAGVKEKETFKEIQNLS